MKTLSQGTYVINFQKPNVIAGMESLSISITFQETCKK